MVAVKASGHVVAGVVLVALGMFVIFEAAQLDYSSEYGPGPGFLPLWLGIGFVVLASPLLISGGTRSDKDGKALWKGAQSALVAWCGLLVAIALLKSVGFVLSFVLFSAFLVGVVERRPPLTALAVAILSALAFYLIFSAALGLPLPTGPWGF